MFHGDPGARLDRDHVQRGPRHSRGHGHDLDERSLDRDGEGRGEEAEAEADGEGEDQAGTEGEEGVTGGRGRIHPWRLRREHLS